jgi:hypothetical protein
MRTNIVILIVALTCAGIFGQNTNSGGVTFRRDTKIAGPEGLVWKPFARGTANLGSGTNFVIDYGLYQAVVVQPTAAGWRFSLINTSTNLTLSTNTDLGITIGVTNATGALTYATNETHNIVAHNSWWIGQTNKSTIALWYDGGSWNAQGSYNAASSSGTSYVVQNSTGTSIDVNTTTTETSIYTNSVPAGTMGANGKAVLVLAGDALNNGAAGTYTWRIRIYWNGAVVYDDTSPAIGLSANRFPWRINLRVANLNSASSQAISATMNAGAPNTAPPTGAGDWGVTTARFAGIARGTASVDTSAAVPIGITITPSDSHASFSFRRDEAELMTLLQN